MENTKTQADSDNSAELEALSHQTNSKPTLKEEFSTFKKYFKAIFNRDTLHLMIAHHPNCEVFDEHVFKIGKLRLCRGCFLSYPPLYALLILTAVWPASREFFVYQGLWIDNLWWFVISFGIFSLIGRLLGRYSLYIKDLSKFARGAWAGFLLIVIFTQHWGFKIGAGIILFGGMGYLSWHRGKDMERTCNECEWGGNFEACPGWKDVTQQFMKINPSSNIEDPIIMDIDNTTISEKNMEIDSKE